MLPKQRKIMKILLLICVVAITLCGQNTRKPVFVSPKELDVTDMLPSPPAPNSWQDRMEMAELHRLQDTRTEAEVAHAKADDAEEDMFVFSTVLGAGFSREKLPLTALLSDHLHNDEGINVNPAKTAYHRLRPYFADATIKPVCKINDNRADYSYPSGHSTTGYLEGLTLALMVPEKRDQILTRADDYAHSRLVCGVHYPTDPVASKSVAYAMMGVIQQNPQFKKEFEAARSELRRTLGLP
jgi:acid phosphatase (class A)